MYRYEAERYVDESLLTNIEGTLKNPAQNISKTQLFRFTNNFLLVGSKILVGRVLLTAGLKL